MRNVMYTVYGLIIDLFRRWRPVTLISVGFPFLYVVVPRMLGVAARFDFLEKPAKQAEAAEQAGTPPPRFQACLDQDVWVPKVLPALDPNDPKKKEDFDKAITLHLRLEVPASWRRFSQRFKMRHWPCFAITVLLTFVATSACLA